MSEIKTNWNRPSDPCPECGSTNTAVKDYQVQLIELKTLGPERNRVPHNPHFIMLCMDCGHSEPKLGCPGSQKT
ncbi:MAG: hypothetical protein WCK57_09315 [Verrucomicrobiae bacterium]